MKAELNHLQFGEQCIEYRVVRRKRKTPAIAVNPDASVVITAPMDASIEAIKQKLRKRAACVTRQQRYFTQFLPRTPERSFVSGETHLDLGRQYRLKLVPNVRQSVMLIRGFIVVQTLRPSRTDITRDLVEGWHRGQRQKSPATRSSNTLLEQQHG
jgi:predicted metal-dependent hydrolase